MEIKIKTADPLMRFIRERYRIYKAKELDGKPEPWTRDPILSEYRFTNVHRENDRVTRWVREHIRLPYADDPNLWFMLCVARQLNWPETLQELMDEDAWPVRTWVPHLAAEILDKRKARGDKVYTGAYMIRAESDKTCDWYSWTKQEYMSHIVLGRVWENRRTIEPVMHESMRAATEMLASQYGWGPFMAYQVAVDLQWTRYLEKAPDTMTWTALGPGSTRGLNRLLGLPVLNRWRNDDGVDAIRRLCDIADRKLTDVPKVIMSDMQNCLCEFDKYERVRLGEGRPRAKFVDGRGY